MQQKPQTVEIKPLEYLLSIDHTIGIALIHEQIHTQKINEPKDIDLAFSSPPYFNLEKYSDEETQCMVRYRTLDEWFSGYVEPTIENIYKSLNKDGIFATNVADYKTYGKKEYKVVDDWITLSERIGFRHVGTIKMMLNTRPGVGNNKLAGREKYEGVYVFSK